MVIAFILEKKLMFNSIKYKFKIIYSINYRKSFFLIFEIIFRTLKYLHFLLWWHKIGPFVCEDTFDESIIDFLQAPKRIALSSVFCFFHINNILFIISVSD